MSDKREPTEVASYPGCFVCGQDNPGGLKLRFWWDGEVCRTSYTAREQFSGYHGLLHGGALASILDEVMIKAIIATGVVAVTGEMKIRYKAPARIADTISFEGRILESRRRLYLTTGIARSKSGELIAESSGTYLKIVDEQRLTQMTAGLHFPPE